MGMPHFIRNLRMASLSAITIPHTKVKNGAQLQWQQPHPGGALENVHTSDQ